MTGLALPLVVLAPPVPAIDCDDNHSDPTLVPMTDLGPGTYTSVTGGPSVVGGLYPGGTNTPPSAYASGGVASGQSIVARDATGNPDPDGKIVFLAIGGSLLNNEFGPFMEAVGGTLNPQVVLVNGSIGGKDTDQWADPASELWSGSVETELANAGVTAAQVSVILMKSVYRTHGGRNFPQWIDYNADGLRTMIDIADSRYPSLEQVYLVPRSYGGYIYNVERTREPYAYEHGYAVRDVVADSIADPAARPWVGWGAYIWTDGDLGRADGFTWLCHDIVGAGAHASNSGAAKIVALFDDHLSASPFAPWYRAGAEGFPTVASVSPATLAQGTGPTPVTLTGTNFAPGATVSFGEQVTVSDVSVVDATTITASLSVAADAVPAGRTVTVTNPDGDAGSCQCFTVTGTTGLVSLTSADPASLPPERGDKTVVLTGSGFAPGATADFGQGVNIEQVSFVSPTRLDVVVRLPNASAGPRTLEVSNPDGGLAECDCFTVGDAPPPTDSATVTSVSPDSLPPARADRDLTVTGTGFMAGATLTFGQGVSVRSTPTITPTQITLSVRVAPSATLGPRTVTITNPGGGGSASCSTCFTVATDAPPPLTVASVAPSSLSSGDGTATVVVEGTEFVSGASVELGQGVMVEGVSVVSSTRLDVTVKVSRRATPGSRDVIVTIPSTAPATCAGCFAVT